jgi:TolA-binding protein
MRILLAACLTLTSAIAMPIAGARAQIDSREGILLQNQVLELRQEVQTLRDQLAHAGAAGRTPTSLGGYQGAPPAAAGTNVDINTQLLDRVQHLEDDLRQLRGRIDEVDNARQREGEDLAKKLGDLNFRLDNGTAPTPGAPVPTTSAGPANLAAPVAGGGATPSDGLPVPPPPPPRRTAEMVLQEGNAALARRDYAASEAAAKEVLGTTGKGPRSTDAQFLLAQSLAGRHDYSAAAVAFDDTYNRSRTGLHAQDSLLGLAGALTAINEKRAACETLDKLRAEFPTPRADLKDAVATARRNAACK